MTLAARKFVGLELLAPDQFPLVRPGDDLVRLIVENLLANELRLQAGDILVLAQKIVSKAEGRYRRLDDVRVSARARSLARDCGKDPRLVELILSESVAVVRCVPGVLIVRHRLGFVHANAGIDHSNIEQGDDQVLLLPADPDRSAALLREGLAEQTGTAAGVLINDSFGRAWRQGTCGVCIGSAGVEVLKDYRGQADLSGKKLEVTEVALGDELAAAASLLMGAADEGRPVLIARGLDVSGRGRAQDLIRPLQLDLFP